MILLVFSDKYHQSIILIADEDKFVFVGHFCTVYLLE